MNKEQFSTDVIEPLGLYTFAQTGSVYFANIKLGRAVANISGKVTWFEKDIIATNSLTKDAVDRLNERVRILLTVLVIHGIPVYPRGVYQQ